MQYYVYCYGAIIIPCKNLSFYYKKGLASSDTFCYTGNTICIYILLYHYWWRWCHIIFGSDLSRKYKVFHWKILWYNCSSNITIASLIPRVVSNRIWLGSNMGYLGEREWLMEHGQAILGCLRLRNPVSFHAEPATCTVPSEFWISHLPTYLCHCLTV